MTYERELILRAEHVLHGKELVRIVLSFILDPREETHSRPLQEEKTSSVHVDWYSSGRSRDSHPIEAIARLYCCRS